MSEPRKRTHEDDLEMSEAINVALDAYRDAAYHWGCWIMRPDMHTGGAEEIERESDKVVAARNALIVAIADRVREVRSGKP